MKRRLTSWLLTLAMLLSLVPAMSVTASAADDTSYGYADINNWDWFKSYLSSDVSRDLTLMKDINYTTGYNDDAIIIKKSQKLDLNGHKIRIDASKLAGFFNLITIRSGEFTLYDSSKGGGGAIEVEFAMDSKGHCIIMISPDSAGAPAKFTMNGGTLTRLNPIDSNVYGNNGCISDNYFVPFEGGERPQITINGGTINCPYDWDRSQYSKNVQESMLSAAEYMPTALLLRYSNLTVNGGTFNGIVWTDKLTPKKEDTEPRVSLNGGVFNYPFAVTALPKNVTQVVIDGAQFNDGFYVGVSKIIYSFHAENDPPLLLKSGVFDSKGKNPKLAIYNATAKYFPNSAITVNERVYTSENIKSLVGTSYDDFYLQLNPKSPIKVIRDAWGVMESVTLDGTKTINYAKDWQGGFEEMDNSTAHTIKFKWKPLASELVNAGYTYRATCEHYISGSTAVQQTDTIAADKTSHTVTIPAGADPKVYSFDLQLNLKKGDNNIGIFSNEHIVKLVVNQAPVVKPDPTLAGKVYYTSGIVFGRPISTGTSDIPDGAVKAYQWQRRTNDGGKWENIDGATSGSYTPVPADMGENVRIRVKITANGYLGEIVGAAVKVSKAANDDTPTWPDVVAQKDDSGAYKNFVINGFNSDQEYVYTTSAPTSGNEWPTGTPITSATVENLTAGSTYYIFTRYKETATQTAGSKIRSSSVLLDDETKLNKIILTDASGKEYSSYGSGNTIYIQKGESMTLTVTKNPSGANTWSKFTFKPLSSSSSYFSVTEPTAPVDSGSTIPSVTIRGDKAGTDTLAAEYSGHSPQYYGTWGIHVYENISDIGTGAEITVSPSFPDMTMYQGETMPLPEYTVDVYPEGALDNYNLAWRIIKSTGTGPSYMTRDDNITLENGKIEATKAHAASGKTRLDLVAIDKNDNTKIRSLSPSSGFYVTVTAAPVIELTGLTVVPAKVNLAKVGDTCQLSAVKEPVNAAGSSLTWASDKTDIATVSVTGEVKAVAAGTATITVTCGSKSATCTVTVAHTHDTDGRDWMYMDPGTHIKTCTAGDDFKVEAHTFSAWTDNGNDTHSHHCTVCKMADGSTYTETANHNWQWVVDTHATSTTAGKQHEECPDCHARRNEGTVIPATGGGSSSGGGGGGGGVGTSAYAITVNSVKNGGVTASHKSASKGTTVTLTVAPDKGYVLDTLTVLDGKDKEIKLTEKSGKFTFTMPDSKVTVAAAFKASAPTGKNPFTDVPAGSYYETAVIWAVDKGITGGTSATTFSPDATCTRAQIVTFLWRAAGSPAPKAMSTFVDVSADAYYAKAVAWAVENGITGGTGDGKFSPDATCTRAQAVTFLWRANGSPAVSGNAAFSDVAANAYYAAAVTWAEKNGITGGIGNGLFGSDHNCTRAQIVTFLYSSMK